MNSLDIIIVVLVLLGGVSGLRQGLIQALANLVGWFFALFVGAKYASDLAPMMSGLSHDVVVQKIVAFATLVLMVVALTWLVSAIINKIFVSLNLGPLNRFAGGILGVLKTVLVILITMQGIQPWVQTAENWKQSKIVHMLLPYAPLATGVTKDVAQEAIEHFHKTETPNVSPVSSETSLKRSSSGHATENPFN
ncbi:CvpA family protein [Acinetobacter rathckeae]|uniref:CvpA family protein n=1 Tax=Acinetobacter rathckeae TaxID=2605272 RepID=UPI0018A28690|nr:CvpA family protein [Acinetobacter rathckeae]MBF7687577.1 CvpA family protein [Acinetobacter rathckeae]MBF7694979.1 CvpA family protein [Acinetobacter rathckeae]